MTAFDSAQDAARCIEIVRRAAAAEIMPRFRQLSPGAIRAKTAPDDLVTDADIAAEEAMTDAFCMIFQVHWSSGRRPWRPIQGSLINCRGRS